MSGCKSTVCTVLVGTSSTPYVHTVHTGTIQLCISVYLISLPPASDVTLVPGSELVRTRPGTRPGTRPHSTWAFSPLGLLSHLVSLSLVCTRYSFNQARTEHRSWKGLYQQNDVRYSVSALTYTHLSSCLGCGVVPLPANYEIPTRQLTHSPKHPRQENTVFNPSNVFKVLPNTNAPKQSDIISS